MQLSIFDSIPQREYPTKVQAKSFWYHERQEWVKDNDPRLESFSHAGIGGFPERSQCNPGFGRYLSLDSDGSFTLRNTKNNGYQKQVSRLYFGEDARQLPVTGLW